ncbi:MAG TPA: NAD(P)(+) transhydrogenase (Re/Si-specific) subunit beta, partial [Acidimicrobiales bacterium]|nr:NAD(P)(+) transhydrogenase (Re/Si-specific) subunit beta [Acidimicrobiales bacterium]
MGTFNDVITLIYLVSATAFVIGLHFMNAPPTADRGNRLSAVGMLIAIGATIALIAHDGTISTTGWVLLATGGALGSAIGLYLARSVEMTAMPQLVSVFNAVGGGAAALVAIADFVRLAGILNAPTIPARVSVFSVLDIVIGAVTFSGSVIAAGKLQGIVPSQPIVVPGARVVNVVLFAAVAAGAGYIFSGANSDLTLIGITVASLILGVIMVLPIG